MPSRTARFRPALHALTLALTIAGASAGCAGTDPSASPSSGSPTATAGSSGAAGPTVAPQAAGRRIEVSVADGRVSGATGRVPVEVGEQVTLAMTSDVADEVHLHGYDLTAELTPGEPAELTFPATVPGVFEVELHHAGTVLLSLQVG
jgi:hypothetical protein